MSPEHRRYLFVQTTIGAAIINAVINGVLGWAGTIGLAQFPMWKTPGVAGDLIATAFGVVFGTCFGVRLQARLDTTRGKITPPPLESIPPALKSLVSRMPNNIWARAFVLGLIAVPLFAPPILALLMASGESALDRGTFIVVKSSFSAAEGALVTPVLLLRALLDRLNVRAAT